MRRAHAMPFGARPVAGGVLFRLWAPDVDRVGLVLGEGVCRDERTMRAAGDGWFELEVAGVGAGARYAFRVDDGEPVPDPASRCNPDGVHAPSMLVDPRRFDWPDGRWRGRPWHESVVYELHVGTFTEAGTFTAAIGRLDDLVALGVTTIELMPVGEFAGTRGWGYDGVLPFAPKAAYGSPDELRRLVAEAHARGLSVLLDVVYNHFGPEGNHLHRYASPFFDPAIETPWGAAINFGGTGSRTVRDFFVHNACYWVVEFGFDGLRLDAVHAMHDRSATHFVDELARTVRALARGRRVHVVLENDLNEARHLVRAGRRGPELADAQWNDDVHHALHVLVTGESDGYYADYVRDPVGLLGRALAEGFAYQGDPSPYRGGAPRGTRSDHLPPTAFLNALQTHDQVGNRAFGERLHRLAKESGREDALRALTACVLLAPSPPMLFMGEEYAADTPFLYFCDYEGELACAVADGRRAEFDRFERFADPSLQQRIPDPNAWPTFADSRLDWSARARAPHRGWLELYTLLLGLRRAQLVPRLAGARAGAAERPAPGTLRIAWPLASRSRWHLLAQLSAREGPPHDLVEPPGVPVYRSHPIAEKLPAWSVLVTLEAR